MRRSLAVALVVVGAFRSFQKTSFAQISYPPIFYPRSAGPPAFNPPLDPVRYPIEIGQYVTVGGASGTPPASASPYAIGSAGIYAQWNRYGFCPGLDLRVVEGNANDLHGYLVGPRVVFQPKGKLNPLRPYAEALFGKNELPSYTGATTSNSITGTTRAFAIGLDLHSDSAFAWRVIEFTKGDFTGVPNSHPQSITTGIVLHLP